MTNYADGILQVRPGRQHPHPAAEHSRRAGRPLHHLMGRAPGDWRRADQPRVVYWSDGDGLDDWVAPRTMSRSVRSTPRSPALYVLRGQLVVATDDGSWWMVTGDPPTSEVPTSCVHGAQRLRRRPRLEPQHGAVIGGQAVWQVDRSAPWPTWFNGSTLSDQNHLKLDLVPTENGGIQPNLIVFPSRPGRPICSSRQGRSAPIGSCSMDLDLVAAPLLATGPRVDRRDGDGLVLVADGGDTDNAPRFFVWQAAGPSHPRRFGAVAVGHRRRRAV